MIRVAAPLLLALPLSCSNSDPTTNPPRDRYETLAARGQIQNNAPVKATSEIIIHASADKVWSLLADIDNWPSWQSAVSAAQINGPLEPGTTFTWTNGGGSKINSRIALVQPNRQLAWTGTASIAHAIHIWNLQPLLDGSTLVQTTESMDGFMLAVFYSSKDLAKSHEVCLDALKRRAEQ